MNVVHCKDCIHYIRNDDFRNGRKCELLDGLYTAEEDDFCSFAATEEDEDAGFECDYRGIRCENCIWYDGYYEDCLYQEEISLGIVYTGLGNAQAHDYCSRAEPFSLYEIKYQEWRKRFTDSDIDKIGEDTLRQIFDAIDDEDKELNYEQQKNI